MNKELKFSIYGHKVDRIDKILAHAISLLSRSKVQELIESGHLAINAQVVKDVKYLCRDKDEVIFTLPETVIAPPKVTISKGKKRAIEVLYEDEYLIVINKPAKLLVHGGAGRQQQETLVSILRGLYEEGLSNIDSERAGIVHRLDMETSGIMLVAKDDITHALLSRMLEGHEIERKYLGITRGMPVPAIGMITLTLKKSERDKTKVMVTRGEGKHSITHYRVLETYLDGRFALCEFTLETGRTHQIRIHMEYKKTPIVGDKVYGKHVNVNLKGMPEINDMVNSFGRHALHSYYIEFVHPRTDEVVSYELPLPKDMAALVARFKEEESKFLSNEKEMLG